MVWSAQIVLMAGAAALPYWAWLELNALRGTVFFEYRYVLLLCGAILLFSVAQAVAGWITRAIEPDDT
ncbi:MAG: hypothetical protein JKY00_13200 [Roseicyclus sp.]|nr:hypothetical protein [Roseicyclus sp.]